MATIVNELKYLREDASFRCCIVEAAGPVYTMDQLNALMTEYNKEIDALVANDSMDRHRILEAGGGSPTGCYKSKNGLAQSYFVYLMASEEESQYPTAIFHSFTNEYGLVVNEDMIGRDVGKLGIFLAWLAMKHNWDCLKLAINALEPSVQTANSATSKQYHAPTDCAVWEGSIYERGAWGPCKVGLSVATPQITQTLGQYIQSDMTLKNMLIQAGGVQKGAHLIPDYIVNQRLAGAISSKNFRDIATQVSAYLDSLNTPIPQFDSICKLMGINE